MKLTLHRTGDFMVAPDAEDSTQCGFARGDRQVFFDVMIESDSAFLDENGFVLDNNAVMHYFQQKYRDAKVFVSCERIALAAIDDLCDLMGEGRCFYISVEIKPGPYAGLKAERRLMEHGDAQGVCKV